MVGRRFCCAQLTMLFLRGLGLWAVLPLLSPSLLPSSVPNLEEAVPGAGGNGHAVCRHPQAAHSVVMARKDSWGGERREVRKRSGVWERRRG